MMTCIRPSASAGSLPGLMERWRSASAAVRVLTRIDRVELRAVAPRFHDEGPQVHVGAENVRAPGDDQLRVAELLGLGAVAEAERRVHARRRRSLEQMVRSSRDAPRRWKKRRSMPAPLSRPMVPA